MCVHSWPSVPVPTVRPDPGEVMVYDSSRRQLVPVMGSSMYVCGITPYDATHIGHANTYLTFDLLNRVWRDLGEQVTYVQNVTDIDDPLLERARDTGVDWQELAQEQTELYRQDMAALRVLPPSSFVAVTETIDVCWRGVSLMLAEGLAYRVDLPDDEAAGGDTPELGDVYADLSTDPKFGSVSYLDENAMLELFGERGGDPDRPGKRNRLDPLLWRRERPGEPHWDGGPLGTGRPGWHVECAIIAQQTLGARCAVLGGGSDLLFPHHEMSVSHARALGSGKAGPDVIMHSGMVAYQGEKMSKSKGNLVFVSQLRADGVDPMVIRLALLAHHYREDWEWTDAELAAAQERFEAWRAVLGDVAAVSVPDQPAQLGDKLTAGEHLIGQLRKALRTDLDAPAAVAAVDEWVAGGGGEGNAEVAMAVDALLGVSFGGGQ